MIFLLYAFVKTGTIFLIDLYFFMNGVINGRNVMALAIDFFLPI